MALDETELKAALKSQLNSAITVYSGLESDQAKALDYYHGRPYGNELEGRSQVVTREVLEQVEWAMPQLLKIFASGQQVVKFDPEDGEDIAIADQETDAVNAAFTKDNDAYTLFSTWFRDALLNKVGYVKIYWDEVKDVSYQTFSGLTEIGLGEIDARENVEIVEHETEFVDDEMGLPQEFHTVKVRITETRKKLVVDPVPPEEMRVSPRARSINLDKSPFVAHVVERTASDLIADGYDRELVESLPSNDNAGENYEFLDTARDQYVNDEGDEGVDDSQALIEVSECYLLLDDDDDGVAELHRVVLAGNEILEKERADMIPFAAITPLPVPHEHVGLGLADLVMDIQYIKSGLLRAMLDNLKLTNNPEREVLEGQANIADLLNSRVGGIKRVKQMGAIREITVPFTAGASLPIVEMLDGMKEARTGISRHTMGLDPDALAQSTMGAFQGAMNQAGIRVEDIARNFAETGVKQLFLKIHHMLANDYEGSLSYQAGSEWVQVEPSQWKRRQHMTVVVGLGTGNKDEQLQKLQLVAQNQEQHLLQGSPLVSLKNLYNTYSRMIDLAGLKDVDLFYNDPDKLPPPQPKEPSESEKLMMLQAQIEQQKAQMQAMKNQMDYEAKMRDLARKEAELEQRAAKDFTELELKYANDVPGSVV